MRDLRLLAVAVGLSAGGDLLAVVTLALVVHDLTGSGLWVSAFFATTMAPAVALAPPAGRLADRFAPARVMGLAAAVQVALAVAPAGSLGNLAAVLALSLAATPPPAGPQSPYRCRRSANATRARRDGGGRAGGSPAGRPSCCATRCCVAPCSPPSARCCSSRRR